MKSFLQLIFTFLFCINSSLALDNAVGGSLRRNLEKKSSIPTWAIAIMVVGAVAVVFVAHWFGIGGNRGDHESAPEPAKAEQEAEQEGAQEEAK